MACEAVTYAGVDSSKWACVKDVVSRSYGLSIDSDVGEASEQGFTLKWRYDPSEQSLVVQCTKKPIFVTCGMVTKRLSDGFQECGIAAPDRAYPEALPRPGERRDPCLGPPLHAAISLRTRRRRRA